MTTKQLAPARFQKLTRHLFSISIIAALYIGWMQRNDNYIDAESGAGYLLGIIGGSLMLVVLMYPISKRVSLLTRYIPVRYWFGIHLLLGVIGPVIVLFHSNFQLGSPNSSIAMICMLLVAGSGLIGRYIYTHIHHGLYGSRITINELKQETENNHAELLAMVDMDETLNTRLNAMESKVIQSYTGLLKSLLHIIQLAVNAQRLKKDVIKRVKNIDAGLLADGKAPHRESLDHKAIIKSLNRYTLALRRAAAFKVYERLFSLWHILHLPLFIMMIITAIIHIFAVHLY